MQITKETSPGTHLITGIDNDAVRINDQVYQGSLILCSEQVLPDWPVQRVSDINDETWQAVMATQPELILLGTGDRLVFPEAIQLRLAYDRGIGVETMDTQAACRTYNLLAHEGRKVTAALIFTAG